MSAARWRVATSLTACMMAVYFGFILLVAYLARCPDRRRAATQNQAIYREVRRLEHLSNGAGWVMHLFRQCSGRLVVHVRLEAGS